MLSMFVILMTVFGSVFAQDSDQPAFKVSSVVTDTEMVLSTKNFPADTDFVISMAAEDTPDAYTKVSRFNTKAGGNLNVKVKIGDKFKGLNTIYLMLESADGASYRGLAVNIPEEAPAAEEAPAPVEEQISLVNEEPKQEEPAEKPAADVVKPEITIVENKDVAETTDETVSEQPAVEQPVVEQPVVEQPVVEQPVVEQPVVEQPAVEQPAEEDEAVAPIPVLVCDFSIIPTVSINSVVKNDSVTFTTANFPANSTFTVSMGYYVSTWVPARYPMPPHYAPAPRPVNSGISFYHIHEPVPHFVDGGHGWYPVAPRPQGGYVTSTFSGTAVGTFETGDGTPQTLTFNIPESLKNVNPIALWISDNGPCGFYSYNYFYNNSTL